MDRLWEEKLSMVNIWEYNVGRYQQQKGLGNIKILEQNILYILFGFMNL